MLYLLALNRHWFIEGLNAKQIVKEVKILKEGVFFKQ